MVFFIKNESIQNVTRIINIENTKIPIKNKNVYKYTNILL